MVQITHVVQSIFSFAGVYNAFQRLLGEDEAKRRFVHEYVLPFPQAKILDIGCGTGAIIEYLPHHIEYLGFDTNPHYIAYAQKKYKGRGTFFCERVSDATVEGVDQCDIVLAVAILHHLNDDEALRLFSIASQCLKPGGSLLTLDNVYIDNQPAFARYIISKDRGQYVRTPEKYLNLAKSSFTEIQSSIVHDMLRIPYTHFIMKCFKY